MDPSRSFCIIAIERIFALVILLCIGSGLLLIALFIHLSAGSPVILTERCTSSTGRIVDRHRFRTTGHGTKAFHAFGRFLRAYSVDELPAYWDVLRGNVSLMEVYRGL